jgi:F-type H+-transporting ATPase subunit gamma
MAAINAAPFEQAAQGIGAYRETVLTGFHAFLHRTGPLPADNRADAAPLIIVFGSDHGLCGNYNEVVAGKLARIAPANASVVCVGAQMQDALAGQGMAALVTLMPPATADGLGRLAGRLIAVLDDLRLGGTAPVTLVFMQRAAHGLQQPVAQPLLPLDRAMTRALVRRPWASRSLPQVSMAPDRLLAALIRSYLFAEIFRAGAEALVTENAARLARMQQAEQSIDARLDDLMAEVRSVRQDEITTELLDVIIGFEALKKRRR